MCRLNSQFGIFGIRTSRKYAMQDVVLIGGDNKALDGEPHLPSIVSGKDISEIPCGHAEDHLLALADLALQGEIGLEVVYCLSENSGPVDGVDGP